MRQVQDILRTQNILVTDMHVEPMNFDAKALRKLTNPDAPIFFQGMLCELCTEPLLTMFRM